MSTKNESNVAATTKTTTETITGADLQASVDRLLSLAAALDDAVKSATDVDEVQALGRVQQSLRSAASDLVDAQITQRGTVSS